MRLRNICRMQAMVMGFGAALLLAGSAHAQEIENANWNDGPGAVAFAQPVPEQRAKDFNTSAIQAGGVTSAAMMIQPVATQGSVFAKLRPVEEWAAVSILVCMGLFALYALTETRHRNRKIDTRVDHMNSRAAL